MNVYKKKDIKEFLIESNAIEGVYSADSLSEALEAWDYAFQHKDHITVEYILEIHRLLLKRLNPLIAGSFRNCAVIIGGKVKKQLTVKELEGLVQNWTEDLKQKSLGLKNYSREQRENICLDFHLAFESIHPFEDGNGRVGRILWNIQRYLFGLPIKIIHEGGEQTEYYELFREDKNGEDVLTTEKFLRAIKEFKN